MSNSIESIAGEIQIPETFRYGRDQKRAGTISVSHPAGPDEIPLSLLYRGLWQPLALRTSTARATDSLFIAGVFLAFISTESMACSSEYPEFLITEAANNHWDNGPLRSGQFFCSLHCLPKKSVLCHSWPGASTLISHVHALHPRIVLGCPLLLMLAL